MNEDTDIRTYLALARRWWWALLLGGLVGATAALFASRSITPMYVASSKIFVQPGNSYQPSVGDIQASKALVVAYSELIETRPVLDTVIERLSLPYTAEALAAVVDVSVPGNLIVVSARNANPELAATIANVTSEVFIDDFQQQQLLALARLQGSLVDFGINQDPQIVSAQAAALNALRPVEMAFPPTRPASPNTRLNVLLGLVAGLVVAGSVVYLLERLDDTVKSPDDLKQRTGLSTLGSVSNLTSLGTASGVPSALADNAQGSALAESFKFLSTSLEFSIAAQDGFKTLLITSSGPAEGKTTVATNLSVALARQGKSVILVDTDLRKPQIHRVFRFQNIPGLTNVLLRNSTLDEVITETHVPGLHLLLSGPLPPDATQVVRLPSMLETVADLKQRYDIVVFDSPPLLVVADALALSNMIDGVMLVVDTSRTSQAAVRQSVAMLHQTPVTMLGGVLNKVDAKGHGRYYYYNYEYSSDSQDGARPRGRKLARWVLTKATFGRFDGTKRGRSGRRRGTHQTISPSNGASETSQLGVRETTSTTEGS